MKFSPYIALAILCLFVSTSCGGSSSLTNEMTDVTTDLVDALKGIEDKASAEAAASEIKEISARMNELRKKMEALPKEEQDALEKEATTNEEIKKLTAAMMTEFSRIMQKPDIAAVLAPVMEDMGN